MKKINYLFSVICLLIVMSLIFTACGKVELPEGMTEDGITAAAKTTVEQLNAKDYDALIKTMDSAMQEALPDDRLAQVWEPEYDKAGAFDSITKTTVTASKGYGVAVVTAKYANKTMTFTLSYNTDMTLGGLYFK